MSPNPCLSSNNDSNHLNALHAVEVVGYRYVTLTICIFGIVCNILNLCVLLQRRLKESPYTYLTGLAIADMLTLIWISPLSLVRGDYIHQENTLFILTRFETKFYMPLSNYFGQVSIMITVALTIERYLFTTYPLRTQSFCKARYARMIIAIILLICAILSSPRFLFMNVRKIIKPIGSFNPLHCATHPFLILSNSTDSPYGGQCFCVKRYHQSQFEPYRNAYYITMFVFNQILPALILLFLNLKLIHRVQHSNRYTLRELVARQHCHLKTPSTLEINPSKQKRLREEHRLTKTLVAVVIVFLVCNTFTIISYPPLIQRITEKKHPTYFHSGFRIQTLVTNIMLLLNYSINFFFYCAFNQKFMDTLRLTFHHRFCSYFPVNMSHQSGSSTTQPMLFNSNALLAHSSLYSHSRIHNSSTRFSNADDDSQRPKSLRKNFRLRTFKDNDVRR